jgi:hypothetical protein
MEETAIASNAAFAIRIIPGLGLGLVVLRRLWGSSQQIVRRCGGGS